METEIPSLMQTTSAEGRRWRQRRKKAKRKEEEVSTMTVGDLPDHLLELVFIHLGYYLCLVRVAVSCRRWHGVVADAGFLTRFRSLHAPHLGEYRTAKKHPFLFVPSAPSTAPVDADSRRFSLDFLQLPAADLPWNLADSRGGLLLLSKKRCSGGHSGVIVCDPLMRWYRRRVPSGDVEARRGRARAGRRRHVEGTICCNK